ncbi:MAG TPA: hypothetical protein ENF81_04805 [Thermotogaceae bacterium]|nr:M55 family metallopeptidase [Thermotogota bacterium]HEW91843.1 hypothetical protein [Thermotogaceae bacterium]
MELKKLFVSIDIEGIEGISDTLEATTTNKKYRPDLMEEHIKMVFDEVFDLFDVEKVVVADSHASGTNLNYNFYDDPRVWHIKGAPRLYYMMTGIDSEFDAAFFLGYHSGANSPGGVLNHTYAGAVIHRITINGKVVNEAILNSGVAGYFNVPVVLISGDDYLEKECDVLKERGTRFLVTKNAIGRYSAMMKPRSVLKKELRKILQDIKSANRSEFKPFNFEPPFEIEIEMHYPQMAELCSFIPQVERKGSHTVIYRDDNYLNIYNMLIALTKLAASTLT